jgi:large subunit ribosomal protein L1
MKRSKNYKEKQKLVDKSKEYKIEEALELLPKVASCKFDASIELHINLNLSEKQKKTVVKGSVTLPHQVGEGAKVAIVTTPEHLDDAKEADLSGGEELVKKIQDGFDDFDILIATPEMMPKLAQLGKVLGPKGKMPNPKNGTVTTDIKKTIQSFKEGKTNFRADDAGGIHQVIGKVSMKKEDIKENLRTYLKALLPEVPNQAVPFRNAFIAPSMGPSLRIDIADLLKK